MNRLLLSTATITTELFIIAFSCSITNNAFAFSWADFFGLGSSSTPTQSQTCSSSGPNSPIVGQCNNSAIQTNRNTGGNTYTGN